MENKAWLIVDFFNKYNVPRTIITCLLPLWLSFGNSYLGTGLGLKDNNGLTVLGWIVNICVLISIVAINIIISFIPKRNEMLTRSKNEILKNYEDTIEVNERMLEITSDLCSRKLSIISENTNNDLKSGIDAFRPIEHLKEISYKIRECVAEITGINKKKIVVSMLYRLKKENEWLWVNESDLASNAQNGAKEFVKDANSTFNYVLNGETFVVFNDKSKASEDHKYVFDDNDYSHKKKGSISCQKISIPIEGNCITVLLSISTYGEKFVDNDSPNDVESFAQNLNDKILSQFTKRISLELLTLYLQTYKNNT